MENLPKNPLLEFHPDTIKKVRELYNFDDPKRLEEAIDILQEWAQKQDHFTVKDFDRALLERIIITNKGLLERCKRRLDKVCTLRTLMPEFFRPINIVTDLCNLEVLHDAILPKLTPDNQRVYMLKNFGKHFSTKFFLDYYLRLINFWQYTSRYDYSAGLIVIYDMTEANLMELLTSIDLAALRKIITVFMEGFGVRIKGIYVVSDSKIMLTILDLIKPVFSKKLSERIHVLNCKDLLKEIIPIDIVPCEYGGKEKSLAELNRDWLRVLTTNEHIEYIKKMSEIKTDESKRQVGKFNEEYLGMAGTFRTLNVD